MFWAVGLAVLTIESGAPDATAETRAVADARREADRLIADAHAGDLFENITHDEIPRIRHLRSGMICMFTPGERHNKIDLYSSPQAPNRGDDVSCNTNYRHSTYTVYASRYHPMPSEAEDLAAVVGAIRADWRDVVETTWPRPPQDASGRRWTSAALNGRHPNGQRDATFAIVIHIGDWAFSTRASGPVSDSDQIADGALRITGRALEQVPPPAEED